MYKQNFFMKKLYLFIPAMMLGWGLFAQTNPAAQALPYSQDFGATTFTTPKTGMAAWTGSGTHPYNTLAAAEVSQPGADQVINGSNPSNGGGGGQYGHAPSANGRQTILQSSNATNGTGQIALALNTTGASQVNISYDLILTIANLRTVGIALQYRVGITGSFTTIAGSALSYNSTTSNGGDADGTTDFDNYSFSLPADALNQPVVQLRWITWRGAEAGNSSGIGLDNISVSSGVDNTPPSVGSLIPADNATGVAVNSTASITFSEPVQKLTGSILVKDASDVVVQTIDVASGVTVNNTIASFSLALSANTSYYIQVPAGSFEDLAGNDFGGIADNTTWNFTTGSIINNVFTANFGTCTSSLSDGFTQFSQTGDITWACTTFGRDPNNLPGGSAPNGVQINGFASGTNVPNIDWIISPSFDLSSTTYPLLSYWSRTKFNGAPLQLMVSTDYVSGDPTLASVHWTELNGRFPSETSDAWTLSPNINLSAFKSSNVHIAFVYTSTDEDGARWTLDDISVDNSAVPPPATLTVSTTDIQFAFVANGSTADKSFNLTGNDLSNDITLTSTGAFQLSKDGSSFSSSITYTVAEANNIPKTVFVRFAPTQNSQNYSGTITISSGSLSSTINVKGTSIDPAITLEVVNWNVEWFGSTVNGPTNDNQQEQNVRTILQNIGADIYGLVEVVDETRLANVVSTMPGYAYVISNYGSHTNPNETPPPAADALAQAQKLAFVYKTSVFTNVSTTALLTAGINTPADVSTTSYNNWASGRYPFMMSADVTLDGVTKNIKFILIHAKANTSPTITSYNRRKAGADELHTKLNNDYASDNVVLLGDFNDDLDQTITDGINPPTTSYDAFTTDGTNYRFITLPLSQAGKRSTVTHDNVIDHVIISNELGNNFMNASANILTDVSGLVSNYGTTTTDHYPVFTRYSFSATLPIKLNYFTAEKIKSSVKLNWLSSYESNSKEYVVERSSTGSQFVSIGSISAKGQASLYEFMDDAPLAGNNYYRLRMVDLDGKFEYSKAIRIAFEKEVLITIRPNPTPGPVKIILDGGVQGLVNISVYDQQGRVIKELARLAGANQPLDIDLSGVNKGIYILKINAAGAVRTEKLVIR